MSQYTIQLRSLAGVYRDTSKAASINPLVSRFETDVMDKLLDQFFDLNTSEAERLSIVQQYRVEQEKVLALQRKQQELDFLKMQVDLVNQVTQLNDQFDDLVSMPDILAGITFGIGASMDDMLKLTSRIIDAMILTAKRQLGIASPSKVFAQIGEYMMQGLGIGIQNSAQVPAMALASVNQQIPYAMTTNRTANIYMGGQTINNGMDDATFTAKVRRIVEGLI